MPRHHKPLPTQNTRQLIKDTEQEPVITDCRTTIASKDEIEKILADMSGIQPVKCKLSERKETFRFGNMPGQFTGRY